VKYRLRPRLSIRQNGRVPGAATQATISDVLLDENNASLLDEDDADLLSEIETVQSISVITG
jgi:hypothetical protein